MTDVNDPVIESDIIEPESGSSVAQQDQLIEALDRLTNRNQPPSTGPSTLGTIGIGFLIFILLIGAVAVIYYISQQNLVNPYPVSPFQYGQKVVIQPAILTESGGLNQCLRPVTNPSYQSPDVLVPAGKSMGGGSALQFTGTATDAESQWELMQYSSLTGTGTLYDANQSLLYGLGNRFYLRNTANTNVNDPSGRIRYQVIDQLTAGYCYSTTPAVIGSSKTVDNWFNTELLIYFMPTNYPNLYWLLFPACADAPLADWYPNTTTKANNGIIELRPWADLSQFGTQGHLNRGLCSSYVCSPGPDGAAGIFYPFTDSTQTTFNNNIMLMDFLPDDRLLPPFENPNVKLFKVTIV